MSRTTEGASRRATLAPGAPLVRTSTSRGSGAALTAADLVREEVVR